MRFLIIAAFILAGCSAQMERVDITSRAETWGRHHGRILAGPRVTYENGTVVGLEVGRQFAVWAPGEPHRSSRAPSSEWQGGLFVSVPVLRRTK